MCAVAQANAGKVLDGLMEGNERFRTGAAQHPRAAVDHRKTLVRGQAPLAIVVGCSDSRVPPEILFDAGVGDLFVIRVAGNVLGRDALGSLEYAVEHLEAPLLVVLGHSDCGAVSAVVNGAFSSPSLAGIADAIRPAVDATEGLPGEWVDLAARENVRRIVQDLPSTSTIVGDAVAVQRLTLVPAYYDLRTGAVHVLDTEPQARHQPLESVRGGRCVTQPVSR